MNEPENTHGVITHSGSNRKDFLFRVTLKAVILDEQGRSLVVKEKGRDWWDTPGGGIDHGETIKEALARELYEEVSMTGDFTYKALIVEDPHYLKDYGIYQVRSTFLVKPEVMDFKPGIDGAEVKFMDVDSYENSEVWTERQIFLHSRLAKEALL